MEEAKEAMKKAKDIIFKYMKRILQAGVLSILLTLILLGAAMYFLTIDDGTYKEDDWGSVPFANEEFLNSLSVNKEGDLENNMTAQELWDKMLENESRVNEYLDTPEELARLMRAEAVTKFPDTRPNPDQPINWEEIIKNPDIFQGIIKFKRANTEGSKSNLIYTDPETFQGYIDQYNNNGDEKAKQEALSHFTLKKSTTNTTKKKEEEKKEEEQDKDTENKEEENKEKQDKDIEKKDQENKDTKEDKDEQEDKEDKNKEEAETKQTAIVTPVSGDGYTEEYTSSAGITYKHYKQFAGSYAEKPYWNGTIHNSGCGPTSIAILTSGLTDLEYTPENIASEMDSKYGLTSYETLRQEMDSLGMASEVIHTPSAEIIQDNLRNGKVMLVSVDNRTKFTKKSHIMAIVDINEDGQVYVCNPGSGDLDKCGWQDIGNITIGCKYIVVTDAGATGVASSSSANSTNSAYTAVVATWSQTNTTTTSTDPEADLESDEGPRYSITTTNINYESMVDPYTMPFDMLWALLVVGEDKDFVFEIADLVYGSEIEITIHDNLTINTTIDENYYTKRTKAIVDATIAAESGDKRTTGVIANDEHDPSQDDEEYVTTKTTITQTNTLDIAVTKADVWIVDYENEYTYSAPTETITTSRSDKQDEESYPNSPTSTGNSYSCKEINNKKEELRKKVTTDSNKNVSFIENINVKYYSKYINQYNIITNKISTQKWIKGTPTSIEKTDEDTKPNFVTIFRDNNYLGNRLNILDVNFWLFEIIETNDSTKDLLDTMKYLLYKATGKSYGVKEFDTDRFLPGKLTNLNSNICGGTIEEKVWFTLRNIGYSEYAVAGVMGNIFGESGFDPTAIEAKTGEGHGLCQWSFGRKVNLFSYAQSKGKDWTDVDIQIEFLVGEIARQGDALAFTSDEVYQPHRTTWENATNVTESTEAFCLGFERCSYKNYLDSREKRVNAAQGYYNQYHGKTWEGTSSAVVKEARGALGVPYVWGGESYTEGMDCSGLVKVCYQRALGVDLPHKASALMTDSHFTTVDSIDKLEAGGIIVTNTHVGIYSGENTVIHEPHTGEVCKEVPLEDFMRSRPTAIFRNYNGQ